MREVDVGQEIRQLVTKDRDAAWLQADDGNAGRNLASERLQNRLQPAAGTAQQAVVVERPAAAERGARNLHREACAFEHLHRRAQRAGMKVIVEGVGPEDHARPAVGRTGSVILVLASSVRLQAGCASRAPP